MRPTPREYRRVRDCVVLRERRGDQAVIRLVTTGFAVRVIGVDEGGSPVLGLPGGVEPRSTPQPPRRRP